MAATTTLTLGLVLHGMTDDPYRSTRDATAGPDVVASVGGDSFADQPAGLAGLQALAGADGVVDHSGPYPAIGADLEAEDLNGSRRTPGGESIGGGAGVWVMGRSPDETAVDQPDVTEGR